MTPAAPYASPAPFDPTVAAGAAPPAARPPRPQTVTIAVVFMATAAAILLGLILLAVVYAIQFDGIIDAAARATNADPEDVSSERQGNLATVFAVGVPCLIMAVWLVATLIPILRGSNTGRILAFVGVSTPILCGLCCGVGGLAVTSLLIFSVTDAGFDEGWPEEDPEFDGLTGYTDSGFYDRLYGDDSPGWSEIVGMAGVLITGALLVAAVALLLVPASNRYFRPRAEVPGLPIWRHPQPGYAQPGYAQPGYAQPGYSYAPAWYPGGPPVHAGGYWAPPTPPPQPPVAPAGPASAPDGRPTDQAEPPADPPAASAS